MRVDRPGVTPSERVVGEALDGIVRDAPGRVILTTFASNIIRLQQAIDIAHRHGRKVAVVGRSMEENLKVASELGYLPIPPGSMVGIDELKSLPANQAMILTTGKSGRAHGGSQSDRDGRAPGRADYSRRHRCHFGHADPG